MNGVSFPIESDKLILRPFEQEDLPSVEEYYALPEVQRYLDWKARDKVEIKQALQAMCAQINLQRPGDTVTLAVLRKSDGRLIGQVSLRWSDATAGQGELRFVFNPAYRGQGYATEAVRTMITLAFDTYNIHRVFARCDARNTRSAKLMHRIGMRLEAHYREHALFQGEWDEELHFAILRREWKRASSPRELADKIS